MSSAKVKMREKKMRNQPANVLYPSTNRNGGDQPDSGGPSSNPDLNSGKGRKTPYKDGWVRGHHKDGGGYATEMPKYITAGAFARARAAEVKAMLKAVSKTTSSSCVFQALPRHMRRRAMSHDVKRLPRRLRDIASWMRKKSLETSSKKKKDATKSKSRKARRRHGNLLLEFNRRQRKNIWLETHIWHAKRFHMVKKWGYCLGDRPTLKCYRPCYRAMSGHCLLQDLSYYCCIELQGEEDKLLTALSQLASKEAGPTFAAAMCLSGCRQGMVTVYKAGRYPSDPLGPVSFLWRPRTQDSTHRQLWIWVHPTLKLDLLPELQNVCHCNEAVVPTPVPVVTPAEVNPSTESKTEHTSEARPVTGTKRKRSRQNADEPPAKKILGDGTKLPGTPVTWKSDSTGIVINDLTMEIIRYRLIGPQSHSVLVETLDVATGCDDVGESHASSFWWPQLCKDKNMMTLHRQQADIFDKFKGVYSSGEIPPGTVLGLTVDDPRLTLPPKKVKALPCLNQDSEEETRQLMLRGVPEHCCQSFLWDGSVRENVTDNKIPEQELNRMRSEVLVPGSRLSPTPPQGRVPILLVHQPGKQVGTERSTWGAGWDLLIPKGWGMVFWIPLVYRGVQVAGLHMSLKHSQNKGAPHFPHDYPDCPAGVRFQQEQETELEDKFKRRPPAKRTNYIKHGCLAPFCCPWQQLAEEWEVLSRGEKKDVQSGKKAECDVLMQEEKHLTCFIVLRNRKSLRLLSSWCRPTTSKGQRARRAGDGPAMSCSAVTQFLAAHKMSMVWVRVSLMAKGKPELHAMLCAPTAEDLTRPAGDLVETPHKDHFKTKNKKKASKKVPDSDKSDLISPKDSQSSSDLVFGLWPDPLPDVASHCSRLTLGWVTQGDFSLSAGCGEALGFVSVTGLLHILLKQPEEHRGKLLVRNPTSLNYRFAKINIEV